MLEAGRAAPRNRGCGAGRAPEWTLRPNSLPAVRISHTAFSGPPRVWLLKLCSPVGSGLLAGRRAQSTAARGPGPRRPRRPSRRREWGGGLEGGMATGKQICRMGQKGLLPGPGEVNLVSGIREFTSEGQRWPTTLPEPTALTMSAEDMLPGKCLLLLGN